MITINDKNYEFKYSLRSMFVWESITGRPFAISTMMDTYVWCYSCIISNQNNPELDFNAFIDACDNNPGIIEEFNKFMDEELKKRKALGGDKKKVTRKGKNSQ